MDKALEIVGYIILGLVLIIALYIFLRENDILVFTTNDKGKLRISIDKITMNEIIKLVFIVGGLVLSIYTISDITDSDDVNNISKIIYVSIFAFGYVFFGLYQFNNERYKTIKIRHDSFLSNTCSLLSNIEEKDGCTEEDAINHAARFYSKELDSKTEISKQFTNYGTRSDDIYNHLLSLDNTEKRMFVMKLPLEYQKDILHRLIAEEKI